MSETQEEVAAAEAYEGLHVPAIFQQWAPKMSQAAKIQHGHRVLDVACGTGALARQLRPDVGEKGSIVGLDPGAGMLAVARKLAPEIEWQQGVAESLPFENASFDAVVCQFGLMFFQDRQLALREMCRVLSPGGRLAIAVWDSLENSDVFREEVALLERLAGREAADALRAPFVLGNREKLLELFVSSELDAVSIETHSGTARFPNVQTIVEADLRGWLPLMGVNLSEELISTILSESHEVLKSYVKGDGTVEFKAPAHIVSARRAR